MFVCNYKFVFSLISLWKSKSKLNNFINLISISWGMSFFIPSEYNELEIKYSFEYFSILLLNNSFSTVIWLLIFIFKLVSKSK